MTEPRVLRDITDGDLRVDNLGGSVGVCTAATGECQGEDPAPEQGWLVGETMLLVAGCSGVGDWAAVSRCGCPSWWMLEEKGARKSHQPLESVEVQMLVGRLALAKRGLAQGPKRKGPEGSSWGVRPGAWKKVPGIGKSGEASHPSLHPAIWTMANRQVLW